jgi:hypothetical protein
VSDEGVAEYGECAGVVLASCTSEHIDRRSNLGVDEARVAHHFSPACTRQATGDSSRPQVDVAHGLFGHIITVRYVGELQPTARAKHSKDLVEHGLLVGTKVEHPVGDHHIGRTIGDGERLGQPLPELDVSQAELG